MLILTEWNSWIRSIIAWIGKTEVAGVTLDIPAHFLGSLVIYYLLTVKGVRPLLCWIILAILAIAKELYDLSALLHHGDYLEPVKDLVVTVLGAAVGHYLSRPVNPDSSDQKLL